MTRIVKPGPSPKSCLTCRKRRKKCDQSKPKCERCLTSGHECLGYEDTGLQGKPQEGPSTLKATRPALALDPKAPAPNPTSSGCQDRTKTDVGHDTRPSILGAASVYRLNGLISVGNDDNATPDSSEDFDHSWPWNATQSVAYSRSSMRQSPHTQSLYGTLSSVKRGRNNLTSAFDALFQSIPPSINATQIMREGHLRRVMSEYDLQRSESWFMSPPPTARRPLLAQLKWSKGMIWTIYLEVQLFQTLDRDPQTSGSVVQRYIDWIDKLEDKFTASSQINASLRETADCLMVQLELAFLKSVVLDSAMGYSLLRKALPRFLHIVAADSKLYEELPNGNLAVLFHRVVNAPRSELPRFALYDTITALILGVPTLVEYGYDDKCDSMSHGHEWLHGIPMTFATAISQMNSWRASLRTPRDDWEVLERRVLAWQPSSAMLTGDSAIISTARVAVQEAWRHLVLIYLYMGICGVSSHDPRVQTAVHRIVQLGEAVIDLPIRVHMFMHCVVAGLAARFERDRIFVHKMLLSFRDTRALLFRGPQFVLVLCHLWHGVGMGGSPVTWDDYIRSRCATIPI